MMMQECVGDQNATSSSAYSSLTNSSAELSSNEGKIERPLYCFLFCKRHFLTENIAAVKIRLFVIPSCFFPTSSFRSSCSAEFWFVRLLFCPGHPSGKKSKCSLLSVNRWKSGLQRSSSANFALYRRPEHHDRWKSGEVRNSSGREVRASFCNRFGKPQGRGH